MSDEQTKHGVLPFLPTRDRRKYTRFLDPLAPTGPGLELFESPEHEALGDGWTFVDSNGNSFTQSPPSTNYFTTTGGQKLSFGQILALAGDFYGVPASPISDGTTAADQQSRFDAAFASLNNEQRQSGGSFRAQQVLAIMQQQSQAVNQQVQVIRAADPTATDVYSQAYTQSNADHYFDKLYNIATGAVDFETITPPGQTPLPWWSSKGMYLQLAAVNWDHFGAGALACYNAGHARALQSAALGNYNLAYMQEAFALHFLTDLFSAGHLRTPRKALHSSNPFRDLCAQLMHDEDSYNGLMVQNAAGTLWLAYGDKRLNDAGNATNYQYARQAVGISLGEVTRCLQARKAPTTYGALALLPQLDVVGNRLNGANWSPLFTLINGEVNVRDTLSDLSCRVWTTTFVYASTELRVPDGGVHSPTGAPPGQASQFAHAISWQNHRIVDSSENDLAPAAAVVTRLDPSLMNPPPGSIGGTPLMPGQLDPAQNNWLCTVFRKNSSGSDQHLHFLSIPMTDAPAFKTYAPQEISLGGAASVTSNWGDPAVVSWLNTLFMVYPNNQGVLYQATYSLSNRIWTSGATGGLQTALGAAADASTYKLQAKASGNPPPRAALCEVSGVGLFMAFHAAPVAGNAGNVYLCRQGDGGQFGSPSMVSWSNGAGAVAVTTHASVSLIEFNTELWLAFVDANNNNAISLLRYDSSKAWRQDTAVVSDRNGNAWTTHSVLSLVQYGGMMMIVINDSSGNLYALQKLAQQSGWASVQINARSGNATNAKPVQTAYALAPTGYQGDAYVVFIDKANGAPSVLTTARS